MEELSQSNYAYTYSCHEDEVSLCRMEMRSLFGYDTESPTLLSSIKVDPSRSPFIKERIDVIYRGSTWEDIAEQALELKVKGKTFKVLYVEDRSTNEKTGFKERRRIERKIGMAIRGMVDLHEPELVFGVMKGPNGWIFGNYHKSKPVWLLHQKKPNNYSTALSTRLARAVVNIAIPNPKEVKAIDPCCGAGTVLIEALSMGINIVGSDLNPLINPKARENIAHFGLKGEVTFRDIRDIKGSYDVAIIDMPYNLCSVLSSEEQLEMLKSARAFAKKVVIITIETIDKIIHDAGFVIKDRCEARKGSFIRQVIACE